MLLKVSIREEQADYRTTIILCLFKSVNYYSFLLIAIQLRFVLLLSFHKLLDDLNHIFL